mgnify:CR=1 FL=1
MVFFISVFANGKFGFVDSRCFWTPKLWIADFYCGAKGNLVIFINIVKSYVTEKYKIQTNKYVESVIFEDKDGEVNQMFEEDLPYDLKASELDLDDYGYGIFYLDAMDNLDRYIDKTITFVAMVLKPENSNNEYFVPGRMAMTCCADDMAFLGYACKYDKCSELENKQWVKVKATVHCEFWKDYNGEGPVLHAISVTPTDKPKEEILNFS